MRPTILVIPAEGNAARTVRQYILSLKQHYGEEAKVIVFEYNHSPDIKESIRNRILEYAECHELQNLEIHAQGGLGAYVACHMILLWDFGKAKHKIRRIFFIGGAPSSAMTWTAKMFHRCLVYFLPVCFFTDAHVGHKLYRKQLALIGNWGRDSIAFEFDKRDLAIWVSALDRNAYDVPCAPWECYFVPNGKKTSSWWDSVYDQEKAIAAWAKINIDATRQPDERFGFHNMTPVEALFRVMDEIRQF